MTNLFNKFKKSLFLIHFWSSLTILETKKLIQVEENTQTIRTIGWTDRTLRATARLQPRSRKVIEKMALNISN